MRLLRCPACDDLILFESLSCSRCAQEVGYHLPSGRMLPAGTSIDGRDWVPCSNRTWQCNWLLADGEATSQCVACRLTRARPDASDTMALEKLADVDVDKRRLLVQLVDLGLPVLPWHEHDGGLAFDLLSSRSSNQQVLIGHANGVITIDLAETLDDYRESLRVRLREPYRTMLGHLRHEVGHYYQSILVETGEDVDLLADCRALFGDERASYSDALDRHYRLGAPEGWGERFISEYATMHPWEDFAECFAHYLHITDTLQTAASAGLVLRSDLVPGLAPDDVAPRVSYRDASVDEMLADWHWVSLLFNRVNRSMGQDDLYPFDLVDPVVEKLGFIHRVVGGAHLATIQP
ncbi:conserved hypothetical protein [metagenome]|uniref:Zinc-ribbon domain-containing protein n=1 Tax=metagenome TaxID=256318 RepID=A0A2P2C1F7_9ZZZZ